MKLRFTFLFLVIGAWCASLMAQTEFSKTGTRWYVPYWYYRWLGHRYSDSETNCYCLGEDTLLKDQTWKKLYFNERLYGAFREQGAEVWFTPLSEYDEQAYAPRLLYDFSMQPGDKFYCERWNEVGIFRNAEEAAALGLDFERLEEMEVKRVDMVAGRRVLFIAMGDWRSNEVRWIEGIGSEDSFFEYWRPFPLDGSSSKQYLLQVVSDGKTVYYNGNIADEEQQPMLSDELSFHYLANGKVVQCNLGIRGRDGSYSLCNGDGLQEINGKIYFQEGNDFPDYPEVVGLLYDFSLKEGDDVVVLRHWRFWTDTHYEPPIVTYDTLHVEKTDSVVYEGVKRKRLFLSGDEDDIWVEGIGSVGETGRVLPWSLDRDYDEIFGKLTCCYRGDECLYLHPDYLDCTTIKGRSVRSAKDETEKALDIRVTDGTASFRWSGSRPMDMLWIYTPDGCKVAEEHMESGAAEVQDLNAGVYYYRLELKDTEEAVAGKLLVR